MSDWGLSYIEIERMKQQEIREDNVLYGIGVAVVALVLFGLALVAG